MTATFWYDRWQQSRSHAHEQAIDTHLPEFWQQLDLPPGGRIFIPLCGKNGDLLWLRAQGFEVLGVEPDAGAARTFFVENQLEPKTSATGPFQQLEADGLTLLCGADFFNLTREQLQGICGAYDPASMISLPPIMRAEYARHLTRILPASIPALLITLDFSRKKLRPPPFTTTEQEVEDLFGARFNIDCLFSKDILAENPLFQSTDLTAMTERAYWLKPAREAQARIQQTDTAATGPDNDDRTQILPRKHLPEGVDATRIRNTTSSVAASATAAVTHRETRKRASPEPDTAVTDHLPGPSEATRSALSEGTFADIRQSLSDDDVPLDVGSVLKNRFVLEEMLGQGGMGVVYKAQDLRRVEAMDRDPYVAVKILNRDFQSHPDSFIALQREAKKAQQLAHPNIITVYDFDRDGPHVFMTMELLEGEPLNQLIRRMQPGALPEKQAISIIEQMARALAYAHKQHIVHSDFKPGNVFLTSKNVVKVVDFGIARAVQKPDLPASDATVFDPGSLGALTPAYASCEMIENAPPDPTDDVYGLAVVAYELLTGQHPFKRQPATFARNTNRQPRRPKEISRTHWNAILHGLQFERKQRTRDATRFLQELSGPRSRVSRKLAWFLSITLLLSVMGVIGMYYYMAGREGQEPQVVLEETAILEPEVRKKVENLLEVAEVHRMVGRDLFPPGSSAYDAYHEVLIIHPHNRQATLGLKAIADRIEGLAQQALDNHDLKKARTLTGKGLSTFPDHEGLLNLQQELNDRSSAQK